MEEKERYQLERPNGTFSEIHDTKLDVWYSNRQPITELLNKQDKHIKELEAQIKTKDTINNLYKTTVSLRDNDFKDLVYENNELKQENNQLKRSQNKKAIEVLEKVLSIIKKQIEKPKDKVYQQFNYVEFKPVIDYVENQIIELDGEKNERN